MTVVLQNGSARQLTPCELAELNGEAPAHSGRQSRPGHDRRRKSLLHGASRPSGSTPATRRGRAAASPPTGVPLQTFQRGWFEQYIKEGKNAIKWTRLSCRTFAANAVRLQLHALAYNLGNFMRTLAMPKTVERWSMTSLREKLIKIGAKVVSHGRYVTFQLAEVAVPRQTVRRNPVADRPAARTACAGMTSAEVRGIGKSGERYAFMQANRTRFSSGALQWEVSIALRPRRRRFTVGKAGERRDAGRKTAGIW